MTAGLLLDTCALIWIADDADLDPAARRTIEASLERGGPIWVSPMTAWEIGLLASRGRIVLTRPASDWFAAFMEAPGVTLAPLPPDVLIASSFLPGTPPSDPVDRILAASARAFGVPLVTRDRALLTYAAAGHMQAIGC